MVLLGYYRLEGREMRRREHLFVCRPYYNDSDRATPFCVRLTGPETQSFINIASEGYGEFGKIMKSFRSSNPAPLAEEDGWGDLTPDRG